MHRNCKKNGPQMSDDGAKMDAQMSESKKKHPARYTTGLLKLSSLIWNCSLYWVSKLGEGYILHVSHM